MKGLFKSILIAGVVLTLLTTSAFAAFIDMPAGEDGIAIQKAVDNGLLTGFEDSTVRPNATITRAQMAAIITRAFGVTEQADISSYTDVTSSNWYYDALSKGVAMGAFQGSNNTLNPNAEITIQEALIVLSRVFDLPEAPLSVLDNIRDSNEISSWAKIEVSKVVLGGYVKNTGYLRPLKPMKRVEFATIMNKLAESYITQSGEYNASNFPTGNVLIKADNVVLKGVTSKNNIYIGDGVKTATIFEDCDLERVVVRGGIADVKSGVYSSFRAVGKGTKMNLSKFPAELVRKYEDGTMGSFYAKPGYGELVILPYYDVEVVQ
ncbi:MAG: S-layer homology domain-containing protein [Clostridia bacterium]|nr:S-layer homology domain-containing protein [Clostridia bacterium]